jgi:polysaccharide biosynthesis protein PslG
VAVLRLLLAAAVLLVLAAVAAPAAHARPARDIAGVAVHPWQLQNAETRERVFAGIEATGVRWVRADIPWSWVEPDRPRIHEGKGHWGAIDPIVHAADRHGLKLIGIVGFTPRWASPSGELWSYPDSQAFETFFKAALRRYPQIPAWELWNEPNFERFSKPRPDAGGFVEFLRAARRARDGVGSRSKLISGGIAPGGGVDVWSWIDQVAAHGGLGLIDGFGIHPYSLVEPDDPRSWMMQLEAVRRRLAQHGRPDLQLWLTEFGAPTLKVANGYAPPLTEAQQADRLRIAFALATRFDWIENLTWYEYRNSCADHSDPECHFGLVHTDLSAKPSWSALRDVVGGATAKLRPRLFMTTRLSQARVPIARTKAAMKPARKHSRVKRGKPKRRKVKRSRLRVVNRIAVGGRLVLPGTNWPTALITLRLPRRGAPPRTVSVLVTEGVFWERFEGRDLTSGTVEVRWPGSDAYEPLTTQVQVTSSTAKR